MFKLFSEEYGHTRTWHNLGSISEILCVPYISLTYCGDERQTFIFLCLEIIPLEVRKPTCEIFIVKQVCKQEQCKI